MKVIMISTDRKAFEEGSEVRERFGKYGSLVDELHIIVFAEKKLSFKSEKLSQSVFLYPTNSSSKLRYINDAVKIGNSISKADLITTQDPFETGIVGVTLARKLKAKLEVQLHTDFLNPDFKKKNIKNIFRVPIGRMVLKKADGIRVVSNRIKESIEKKLPRVKVIPAVLPIFVDTDEIKNAPISTDLHKKYPQFEHITLMVSRLEKEKNIGKIIRIFKDVAQNHPRAGLIVVGDGSERKALESAVKRLKIGSNVIFEGWQNELASYYKTSDLFLNTSLYEGYGRTIVEALASGTPVLSTDVGIAAEVGADIFTTDKELTTKIKEYIEGKGKSQILQNYPYTNESEYLNALKDMWRNKS